MVGAEPDYWPAKGWRTASPASVGIDADVLGALDAEFAAGAHGYVDGMLVIKNGYAVFDRPYFHDYHRVYGGRDLSPGPYNYFNADWHPYFRENDLHTMQSVTKSVASAVIGIAVARHHLSGLDEPILQYFD